MVCLGNICRSPLAEGIMKEKVRSKGLDWHVDSAGTAGYHIGQAPDPRSINEASRNGIDIRDQKSRMFIESDFENFDLILAMDSSNYSNILQLASTEADRKKTKLILNYSEPGMNRAVPDPYYDGKFSQVYNLLEKACTALIERESN